MVHDNISEFDHVYRFTTDPTTSYNSNPLYHNVNNVFYDLKKGIGPFEIVDVKESSQGTKITVYCLEIDEEFTVLDKWFQILFEPIDNDTRSKYD